MKYLGRSDSAWEVGRSDSAWEEKRVAYAAGQQERRGGPAQRCPTNPGVQTDTATTPHPHHWMQQPALYTARMCAQCACRSKPEVQTLFGGTFGSEFASSSSSVTIDGSAMASNRHRRQIHMAACERASGVWPLRAWMGGWVADHASTHTHDAPSPDAWTPRLRLPSAAARVPRGSRLGL